MLCNPLTRNSGFIVEKVEPAVGQEAKAHFGRVGIDVQARIVDQITIRVLLEPGLRQLLQAVQQA